MNGIVILSTYPNKKSIQKIANDMVQAKLVACVNITKISSVYSWQGKIENADEFLAIFKTTQKNKTKLKSKIKKTHPYKVPEIAELAIKDLNKPYLQWLVDSTI
ncbi:MAG: divalent-cation tolerance protein CutA [Nitrososphaeria archaeon]|nr:divalent-cation tolerance protein CutA [Nitrososphaeria archaeon]NDB51693.1 divalent-cation tolerance protein CutA [Nitrosopumilaceae archaeon]NDB90815.1 divalent-cation tolerance protein CutA [Nitrososphaerota archaeon]NDB92360.1 divalent-cation tolerance protein CutA [Nitrososphaeria archaeon]NDF27197.1 divalent-cation tolerance protein CutA [Nitrosopumilaceae archaeon]